MLAFGSFLPEQKFQMSSANTAHTIRKFYNFKWFNIKAATADHFQKILDELLGKGVTGPSTSSAAFYPNFFVVPNCTYG